MADTDTNYKTKQKTSVEPDGDPKADTDGAEIEPNEGQAEVADDDASSNDHETLMNDHKRLSRLEKAVMKLSEIMDRGYWASVAETTEMVKRPWRAFYINVLIGLSRGVGFSIGLALLGTIILIFTMKILQGMVNIPFIGETVAEIVKVVQEQLERTNGGGTPH